MPEEREREGVCVCMQVGNTYLRDEKKLAESKKGRDGRREGERERWG